jgi:heme/copper-type cytochrome/quinol oxidase subunit 2
MRSTPVAIALALALCAGAPAALADGFDSDVETIQIVSASVGGKNVYIPSTIVVTGGKPVTLSLFNTTDVPHGFAISGIGVEAVLPAQQEYTVKLPALEGGHVYRVHCQLHPGHVSATLVVLPGKTGKK